MVHPLLKILLLHFTWLMNKLHCVAGEGKFVITRALVDSCKNAHRKSVADDALKKGTNGGKNKESCC